MTVEQENELRRTAKENLDKIKALPEDNPGYQAAKELGIISWYENLLHDLGPETPESNSDHFGEAQAEGLDNLLAGLKDTPHDDRW